MVDHDSYNGGGLAIFKKKLDLRICIIPCLITIIFTIFLLVFDVKISFKQYPAHRETEDISVRRVVRELDVATVRDINSPEWLAIRTGQLNTMFLNEEIEANMLISELMNMSCGKTSEAFAKKRYDYLFSLQEYLENIKSLNEKVLNTRYSEPVYISQKECYVERAQYFKSMTLYYKQRFIFENDRWAIINDGIQDAFEFQ
ncbi:MAG: hypothetical protein LBS53_08460 [Synergistaceae bacterium]|jgi:hypothetical protein|nr:hypothetical protein [Synergistaceae bacterium]